MPVEPLGLTRVAFACQSVQDIGRRQLAFTEGSGASAYVGLTSARIPRRNLSGGSLFWILKHMLVARQPILGVDEIVGADAAIARIRLSPQIIPVVPSRFRAHQGWRYLAHDKWPPDQTGGERLPQALVAELAGLSLL